MSGSIGSSSSSSGSSGGGGGSPAPSASPARFSLYHKCPIFGVEGVDRLAVVVVVDLLLLLERVRKGEDYNE